MIAVVHRVQYRPSAQGGEVSMAAIRVLVAGGTGQLGINFCAELASRGCTVRLLSRSQQAIVSPEYVHELVTGNALKPDAIAGACKDVDVVFSALGASVQPSPAGGRSSFRSVDLPANLNLLKEAKSAGVKRFVYISLFGANAIPQLNYVSAHEDVVKAIKSAGLGYAIVRPTGFFSAFRPFVEMARKDEGTVIGDGSAKSNPIDDRDLAEICADLIHGTDNVEIAAGGP